MKRLLNEWQSCWHDDSDERSPMITLDPMTEAEYSVYEGALAAAYAEEQVQAGAWDASTAVEQATESMREELPDGLATPNNDLYLIREENISEAVGQLWVKINEGIDASAFIMDIEIYAPYQRRGYAQQALAALEAKLKARGISKIGLHVHAFNTGAQALYEKVGYSVTGLKMLKRLDMEA
ncbi:MAG: GNAT family N-acetyltransferase [Chloroflexota bacterium]